MFFSKFKPAICETLGHEYKIPFQSKCESGLICSRCGARIVAVSDHDFGPAVTINKQDCTMENTSVAQGYSPTVVLNQQVRVAQCKNCGIMLKV
jgi:hypothetical protein